MVAHRTIEVRMFKWPRRPRGVTLARLLGEDSHGIWLGVAKGNPWWNADRSDSGVFYNSLIKLVPHNAFWSACFNPGDPVVDVDIVLPAHWSSDVLEEVDLELDLLRYADGTIQERDRDEFDRVRGLYALPEDIVAQAEATCERVRTLVEQRAEPFGKVGRNWLTRFLAEASLTD